MGSAAGPAARTFGRNLRKRLLRVIDRDLVIDNFRRGRRSVENRRIRKSLRQVDKRCDCQQMDEEGTAPGPAAEMRIFQRGIAKGIVGESAPRVEFHARENCFQRMPPAEGTRLAMYEESWCKRGGCAHRQLRILAESHMIESKNWFREAVSYGAHRVSRLRMTGCALFIGALARHRPTIDGRTSANARAKPCTAGSTRRSNGEPS